jgi:tetratricopeptide (TPR) repeat protein
VEQPRDGARPELDRSARAQLGRVAREQHGLGAAHAGEDDAAIELFEVARDEWLADGRAGRARIARWSIARCRRAQGELEAALSDQHALAAELDALGETDGYVFEEIGECLLALGRTDTARPYFARASELLADDPSLEGEPERLQRLRALAGGGAQTEP